MSRGQRRLETESYKWGPTVHQSRLFFHFLFSYIMSLSLLCFCKINQRPRVNFPITRLVCVCVCACVLILAHSETDCQGEMTVACWEFYAIRERERTSLCPWASLKWLWKTSSLWFYVIVSFISPFVSPHRYFSHILAALQSKWLRIKFKKFLSSWNFMGDTPGIFRKRIFNYYNGA